MSINTGTDITGLTANTAYTFYCYPINKNGQESTSTSVTFTTPGIITSFSNGTQTHNTIPITYGGTYSKVKVYYSTTSGGRDNNVIIPGSSTTSGSITGLSSLTTYYLNIYPINSADQEGTLYGTQLSVTTTQAITYRKFSNTPYITQQTGSSGTDNYNNYWNFFGYSNTASETGTITKSSSTFTLSTVYDGSPDRIMIVYDFRFTPDRSGTWYFGLTNADDIVMFYMGTTVINAHESDFTSIFVAKNNSSGGTIILTSGTKYYARLVYVNTGGGWGGNTFKYGRPTTENGTNNGSDANTLSSDFTNYI